jgi:hypothetical protein
MAISAGLPASLKTAKVTAEADHAPYLKEIRSSLPFLLEVVTRVFLLI